MKTCTQIVAALFCLMIFVSCTAKETPDTQPVKLTNAQAAKLDTAYFAEGCFWCAEEVFQRVKGVTDAVSGYSGGTKKNPSYEEVGSGTTDHAESIAVYYDPEVISYRQLVHVFFNSEDPTQVNGQGPDHGRQYRSIIFYRNAQEKQVAEDIKQQLNDSGKYDKPIAAEITKFTVFYKAEAHHQEFFTKHPKNPYILHESKPRVARFMKRMPEILKDKYKRATASK